MQLEEGEGGGERIEWKKNGDTMTTRGRKGKKNENVLCRRALVASGG